MIRYDILPTHCGDLLIAINERGLVHVRGHLGDVLRRVGAAQADLIGDVRIKAPGVGVAGGAMQCGQTSLLQLEQRVLAHAGGPSGGRLLNAVAVGLEPRDQLLQCGEDIGVHREVATQVRAPGDAQAARRRFV